MPANASVPDYPRQAVTGLVLAGGQARRMGGLDKGLVELAGRPMIEYALDALRPQVGVVLINANRNLETYRRYGHAVLPDALEGYLGPLAGTLTALRAIDTPYLLTVPCDSPLLATDLAGRMYRASRTVDAEITVAHDGERQQPVFLLLRREVTPGLEAFLASGGRKIDQWFRRHRLAEADLSGDRDSFVNVNDPGERERVEALLLSRDRVQ
jgi:molybdopterin-guanine dinucleotide biosynthesis protein A